MKGAGEVLVEPVSPAVELRQSDLRGGKRLSHPHRGLVGQDRALASPEYQRRAANPAPGVPQVGLLVLVHRPRVALPHQFAVGELAGQVIRLV